jgi:hypothetical protein
MTARLAGLVAFGISFLSFATPPMGLSTGGSAPPARLTVVMSAATLGDDCGLGAGPGPAKGASAFAAREKAKSDSMERRACEQSSMQLSVTGGEGASSTLQVKKVELFDDKGALLGELTARSPSVWSESGAYQPWDQTVAAGQRLSVSYALSQPNWAAVPGRWNKTFVVKALISVGGADQTVQRDVRVAAPPTSLPANVKT